MRKNGTSLPKSAAMRMSCSDWDAPAGEHRQRQQHGSRVGRARLGPRPLGFACPGEIPPRAAIRSASIHCWAARSIRLPDICTLPSTVTWVRRAGVKAISIWSASEMV